MQTNKRSWTKVMGHGIMAGMIWGLAVLAVNAVTGFFLLEDTILHNLVIFSAGGAIFGVVTGGLLMILFDWLPFERIIPKAILVSTGLWTILRISGFFLSSVDPERYKGVAAQIFQGFLLSILLGGILGFLWKIEEV